MRPREGRWEVAQTLRLGTQPAVVDSVGRVAVSHWSVSQPGSVEL